MAPLKKIKVKSIPKPTAVKKSSPLEFLLTIIALLAILAGILYGMPRLNRYIERRERKAVDKNGAFVKAAIYRKQARKGRSVSYKYTYKGTQYKDSKSSRELYEKLTYGDVILIKIDTLDPETNYIVEY